MTAPLFDARRAHYLAMIVGATFFIEYLDTTIVATALPQMAKSFAISPNQLSIGMSAYMLALAVFIPISGWIADRFGTRTVFASAIAVFTIASMLCGISNGLFEFTAARLLQGVGGAMMVPVGRLIVIRNTEKSQLMKAISTITWPGIIAPMIGPPVGGFITTFASWRWIFLLNVPLGIACIVLVMRLVKNGQTPARWLGFCAECDRLKLPDVRHRERRRGNSQPATTLAVYRRQRGSRLDRVQIRGTLSASLDRL